MPPVDAASIRMRLEGARQVVYGLAAVDRQVTRLGRTTQKYTRDVEEAGRRSFLMNQALFTMRRYAYAGTLALTGLASAATILGIKFNASMEMNQVAFEHFLGSERQARQELQYLYELAKFTPFEFGDLTAAARRFLAFGYTLKETNENLKTIGDTVAAFGGSQEQIQRMVLVFGQIRASGRLLGQDMLQLQQQGIPTFEILSRELGLTGAQLARIGELGISAQVGIPALLRGMQRLYGGAAQKQAATFTGQLSTLHDNVMQLIGALTFGAFDVARGGLFPALNKMFGDISDLIQKQEGKISIEQAFGIAEMHFPWLKPILNVVRALIDVFKIFWNIIQHAVIPSLVILGIVFSTVYWILRPVLRALQWLTQYSAILVPVIMYLVGALILERTWLLLVRTAELAAAAAAAILSLAHRNLRAIITIVTVLIKLDTYATRAWTVAKYGSIRATNGQFLAMTRFEKVILKVRTAILVSLIPALRGLAASMMALFVANPIGLIILAVVAVIGVLVVLYFRWKRFHDFVNRTWEWIRDHWKLLAVILLAPFLPLIVNIILIIKLVKVLIGWVKGLIGWIKSLVNWFKKIPGWGTLSRFAKWAGGAMFGGGGGSLRQEAVNKAAFPTAPAVAGGGAITPFGETPVQQSVFNQQANRVQGTFTVNSTVNIDGKKVAENTAKHKQNAQARK